MAAVYWKQDSSSSGARYHRVTTYSVMKFDSELHNTPQHSHSSDKQIGFTVKQDEGFKVLGPLATCFI